MDLKLNTLITAIYLFFVTNLIGQTYDPIYDGNTCFFADSEGNVKAIKIDSTTITEQKQIHHLNKVWNFDDQQCIKPNGSSWIGKECIQSTNTFLFLNKNNDTIIIKPHEGLLSSWVLYKFGDGQYIQAQIKSIDQLNFLGMSDSIKTISLQLMSINDIKIDNRINSLELQISKNYGFIKLFNILDFPETNVSYSIIGMSNPNIGKNYISDRDIYNYDINDEFHYEIAHSDAPYGSGKFSKTIKRIINKYISENTDTVIYSVQMTTKTDIIDWTTYIESHSFSIDTIPEKHIFNNKIQYLPEQPITNSEEYSYDSYFLNISIQNKLIYTPSPTFLIKSESNCWSFIFYDPISYYSLMEGCGLFISDYDNIPAQNHELLVYYKKSTEIWGTPLIVNSISTIENNLTQIYPNPINENETLIINITNSETSRFKLCNLIGTTLLEVNNLKLGENSINLNGLNSGIYLIRIIGNNNNCQTIKLIKK